MKSKTKKIVVLGALGLGALFLLGSSGAINDMTGQGSIGGQDEKDNMFPLTYPGQTAEESGALIEDNTEEYTESEVMTTSNDTIYPYGQFVTPDDKQFVSTEFGTAYSISDDQLTNASSTMGSGYLYPLGTAEYYKDTDYYSMMRESGSSYYNPKTGVTGEFIPETTMKKTNKTNTISPTSTNSTNIISGSSKTSNYSKYFKIPKTKTTPKVSQPTSTKKTTIKTSSGSTTNIGNPYKKGTSNYIKREKYIASKKV